MLDFEVIDGKEIVGLEVMTLTEAKDKAEKKGFYLKHQSKVPMESYGMLKGFRSDKKEGYFFLPIIQKGEILSEDKGSVK